MERRRLRSAPSIEAGARVHNGNLLSPERSRCAVNRERQQCGNNARACLQVVGTVGRPVSYFTLRD